MHPERFASYLQHLTDMAASRDDVVGLVAFGSTSALTRADDGSDHDFAWLVAPGSDDRYRFDLTWLPEPDRIVASAVEHHGGVKVIYGDGHRLEFGIAEIPAFATWAGGPVTVLFGDDTVRDAAETVTRNRPAGALDPARESTLFLTQLLSGIGRARRGETLSASGLIRGEAVEHLLQVLAHVHAPDDPRLDPLDPRRRFDSVLPHLAAQIETACRNEPLDATAALLDLAERELAPTAYLPAAAVAAVRGRLD